LIILLSFIRYYCKDSSDTCSKWHYGTCRRGAFAVLSHIVQTLEYPTNSAISSTNQNFIILNVAEHIQPGNVPNNTLNSHHEKNDNAIISMVFEPEEQI
jgi:hypothetical protein